MSYRCESGNVGFSSFFNEKFNLKLTKFLNEAQAKKYILFHVTQNLDTSREGYRAGVILVDIPSDYFYSTLKELKDGDYLLGRFSKRVQEETPRINVKLLSNGLDDAKYVSVVLYRFDVLKEDDDNTILEVNDGIEVYPEWEIITILQSTYSDTPMDPNTLMYNHFKQNGGTDTKMSSEKFEQELKKSFLFWKDKALVKI